MKTCCATAKRESSSARSHSWIGKPPKNSCARHSWNSDNSCRFYPCSSVSSVVDNFVSWCLGGEKLNCLHVARGLCPSPSAHRVFAARWRLPAGPVGGQGP